MPILKLKPQWELGQIPQAAETELPSSDRGNLKTVEIMRRVARQRSSHPKVRALALKILEGKNLNSHYFLDECRALAEFVQENVRYVRDIDGVEQLHDPLYLISQLERGTATGDCDDMSLLLATLLLSIGCSPKFAIVRYRGTSGPYNHIYVVAYERNWNGPRQRLVMDTIIKNQPIGYEIKHASRKEIEV